MYINGLMPLIFVRVQKYRVVAYLYSGDQPGYQDNEACGFLINPPCGDVVNINSLILILKKLGLHLFYDGINQLAHLFILSPVA